MYDEYFYDCINIHDSFLTPKNLSTAGRSNNYYSVTHLYFESVANNIVENLWLQCRIIEGFFCRNLTQRQRELIEEFAKEERGEYEKRAAAGASRW